MQEKVRVDESEISLKELFLRIGDWTFYILARWKTVTLIAILGGGLGFFISTTKQPLYKAKLSFALEDDKPGGGLGGAMGLASQFGLDLGGSSGGAFAGDNLLELMKSRSIIQQVLLTSIDIEGVSASLADFYIDFSGLKKKWASDPGLSGLKFVELKDNNKLSRLQDSVLGEFHQEIVKNNLKVSKVDKKLSIVSVEFNSENEIFSKYFTEVLVDQVSQFYVETKTKKSSQNVAILQKQTDSVRRQLNGAISGVAASVDVNPNPNMARQVLLAPSQRRQVDVQANAAILTELVKNLEMSKIALRKETPLIQVIDYPILPLEVEKPNVLKSTLIGVIMGAVLAIAFFFLRRLFMEIMG